MLIEAFRETSWEAARAEFRWPLLDRLNIGDALSGEWARSAPEKPALLHLTADDAIETWSYGALDQAANRAANAFIALGVARGDRVALMAPQGPAAAAALIGAFKLGAILTPLSTRFGAESLGPRLEDAACALIVADAASLPALDAALSDLPRPPILCVDGPAPGALGFWETLERAADGFRAAATTPDDPALLCYTSGTTGRPKGALHGHRVLLAHLPGAQMWTQGFPRDGDLAWTPSEWAWLGGLGNTLMPVLHAGAPLIASAARFDPERAYALLERLGVSLAFLPPTAMRLMRSLDRPRSDGLKLRAIGAAGEPLGAGLLAWAETRLGVGVNEFYGQTECNMTLSNNAALFAPKPGCAGRPTPGCEVAILDDDGQPAAPDAAGEIAVRRDTPALFLGYWRNEAATARLMDGPWMRTGDAASMDAAGYARFTGRLDDIIASAGYRLGPTEIEDCLGAHEAVAMAGAVGAPDAVRGETVVAFVTLKPGIAASDALAERLIAHARARLGGHAAPRRILFMDALPLTSSGKIMRRLLRERAATLDLDG